MNELEKIATRKIETKLNLDQKYKTADQVKTSFGYIGIACLTLLSGAILLNDIVKLTNVIYQRYSEYKAKLRQEDLTNKRRIREENEEINASIQIEIETDLSLDLEDKLEKFHHKLIKSVAKSKKSGTNLIYKQNTKK